MACTGAVIQGNSCPPMTRMVTRPYEGRTARAPRHPRPSFSPPNPECKRRAFVAPPGTWESYDRVDRCSLLRPTGLRRPSRDPPPPALQAPPPRRGTNYSSIKALPVRGCRADGLRSVVDSGGAPPGTGLTTSRALPADNIQRTAPGRTGLSVATTPPRGTRPLRAS